MQKIILPIICLLIFALSIGGVSATWEYALNDAYSTEYDMGLSMNGFDYSAFIMFGTFLGISKSYSESAEIDGANKWQMLWTITFPLIKSVLMIVCLFTIMQITTINVSFVNPIIGWIDEKLAASSYNLGILAVGAWMQTIVVLIFVIISFLLFREKEFVSKDKNYEEMEEINFVIENMPKIMDKLTKLSPYQKELDLLRR